MTEIIEDGKIIRYACDDCGREADIISLDLFSNRMLCPKCERGRL